MTVNEALDIGHSMRRDAFTDYAKAVDHISYPLVVSKLRNPGVDHWIVRWLHSF